MKRIGHTSVQRGKKVLLWFQDGKKIKAKFLEKKGDTIITDLGKFSTREVYNISLVR